MTLTLLHGYPDRVGKRLIFCGFASGPKSYVNTATFKTSGDPIPTGALGFQTYIDVVFPALSLSGTYIVRFVPSATGPRATWTAHWYTESSGTEVANAVDLSAEAVQFGGYGGVY